MTFTLLLERYQLADKACSITSVAWPATSSRTTPSSLLTITRRPSKFCLPSFRWQAKGSRRRRTGHVTSMPAQINPRRTIHPWAVLHASASLHSGKKRSVGAHHSTPKVYTHVTSLDAAREEDLKKKMANYEKELRAIGKKKNEARRAPVDQGMSISDAYMLHIPHE